MKPGGSERKITFDTHDWEARVTDGSDAKILTGALSVYYAGSDRNQYIKITELG